MASYSVRVWIDVLAIERQVFETKSRHLVLMLHFGFHEKYRHKITLVQIQNRSMFPPA